VDSGIRAGDRISDLYDPLVAKLVVHDVDREHARRRMLRALEEFVIDGPATLLGFHRALLSSPCFVEGGTCRGVTESEELAARARALDESSSAGASAAATAGANGGAGATRERSLVVELDGRRHELRVHSSEPPWAELARRHRERRQGLTGEETGAVVSPMQGVVLGVEVADGQEVEAGALICVIEAMKMENEIVAHRDGVVSGLSVAPGQQVAHGELICVLGARAA
jgi:acetyl-CoA/propionyl-CoA carboxylase biotin carboxyl carrier protein